MAFGPIAFSYSWAKNSNALELFPSHRPPKQQRKFISRAVEETILRVKGVISDPELAWMFENCYPNTLDTAVQTSQVNGKADTFIITGDIDAMWLRDSSSQVWPYVPLAKDDADLKRLFQGLIGRQCRSILLDPYANAFLPDANSKQALEWAVHDMTEMRPGVAERKWEIDSLCHCIRLAYAYWHATGDTIPFGDEWERAMRLVVGTFRNQQRKNGHGNYRFQRNTETPTDTVALDGYGNPARPVGLIFSMFRPSDDACTYPLFVPANFFAAASLRQLGEMSAEITHDRDFAAECLSFADEIQADITKYGNIQDAARGDVWAYEVDGFGNQLFMDDANVPSLLSLPYLGCCKPDDPLYRRTRARVLSESNPYYFKGTAAAGVGGPHEGLDMIWPMAIIMQALTSSDDDEILQCLRWLKNTHAGTGFMHEAFNKNDPSKFTRKWFAWANSLFGELIVTLSQQRPQILRRSL